MPVEALEDIRVLEALVAMWETKVERFQAKVRRVTERV
jgi:hypothetical protein